MVYDCIEFITIAVKVLAFIDFTTINEAIGDDCCRNTGYNYVYENFFEKIEQSEQALFTNMSAIQQATDQTMSEVIAFQQQLMAIIEGINERYTFSPAKFYKANNVTLYIT